MQRSKITHSGNLLITLTSLVRVAATIALLFGSCPSIVGADPADKKILLGVPPDGWPPYVIVKEDQIVGIAVDVLRNLSSKRGFELQIERYPEKRAHLMVAQGTVDAWPDAKEWNDNPERYLWTDPILDSEDVLIFRRDKPIVFNQIEDLFGKTIGSHIGYVYPELDRHFDNETIKRAEARSDMAMLKMVQMGRTDAAVINKWVALWILKHDKNLHYTDFAFSKRMVGQAGYRILFTRKQDWGPFIKNFNNDLRAMKLNGQFIKLTSKYR